MENCTLSSSKTLKLPIYVLCKFKFEVGWTRANSTVLIKNWPQLGLENASFTYFTLFCSLSYPISHFLFICFLVMTEIVTLTRTEVLPNPAYCRYSFWASSYPGTLLRRPSTLLPPRQALRHQTRRYTSSLLTSAHIPQTPALCEETFVECAFYYSILC